MPGVIVSNISTSLGQGHLKDLFGECGTIKSITLQNEGTEQAICHIEYSSESEIKVALLLSDVNLAGLPLKVVDSSTVKSGTEISGTSKTSTTEKNTTEEREKEEPSPAAISHYRAEEIAKTIYLGNLLPTVDSDDIVRFFHPIAVAYVKMASNVQNGVNYAFVEFESIKDAQRAKAMNGQMLSGRGVKIGPAQNPISKSSVSSSGMRMSFKEREVVRGKLIELQKGLWDKYGKDEHSGQERKRGRSRSVSRSPISRPAMKSNVPTYDSHAGMVWDGFQWISS